MRRVAVLPINYDPEALRSIREMESAFHAELIKTSLFEVVPVSREDLLTDLGSRQFSSVETLPGNLLERLRVRYGVDGVLFIDVTHFFAYRPLSLGIRAKLVDVSTGRIRWAFDYLFDSGNAATAVAASRFDLQQCRENRALPGDGTSILSSPARFSKYAAYEVFRSLRAVPRRQEPERKG